MNRLCAHQLGLALLLVGCEFEDKIHHTNSTAEGADAGDKPGPEGGAGASDPAQNEGSEESGGQPGEADPDDSGFSWVTTPTLMPRSIHASWQNDPGTTLTFVWTTTESQDESYVPRVWIATVDEYAALSDKRVLPLDDTHVFEGESATYLESLFGIPTSDELFIVHQVEVTGLSPSSSYVYKVGSWEGSDPEGLLIAPNLSDARVMRTGPARGSREKFAFVMAGDSRGGTQEILQHIERLADIDVVGWFYNGDMTDGGTQLEWDSWFSAMAPLLERRPLMSVQGNHEIFADLYYMQMAMPLAPELDAEVREHAWSLTIGNVHIIGLDSNTQEMTKAQVPWLDAELARAKADPNVDWVVTMCHHPPYSASNHGSTDRLQEHFVPVFEKHGLDLSFSGHDHNYERTFPIRGEQKVAEGEGVTYVVAGAFFSPPYSNGTDWWTATSAHGNKRNYVVVEVEGKKLTFTAYSGDGNSVLDQHTLTKP
jgi:hypothetical protein